MHSQFAIGVRRSLAAAALGGGPSARRKDDEGSNFTIHTFNGDKSVVRKYEQCVLVECPLQPVSEAVTKFRTNAKKLQ